MSAPDRRELLRGLAGAATIALAPGVTLHVFEAQARAPDQKVSAKTRWGMLIDVGKCGDGCTACVEACKTENGWGGGTRSRTDAQWIRALTVRDPKTKAAVTLPMMCQHCANPPCVDVCPTGASFRRADGIVLVDKHICIGCRYCVMACPYGARSFVHEAVTDPKPHAPRGKGTVESCTLCVHRIDAGHEPACAEACADRAGGAMLFGDLNDPDSEIAKRVVRYRTVKVRADLGCDPGVAYRNL
ncbi:MAG: 4Fe-4S dicluster domain-containing protein [Alphaproteobacteria bacterium]|nr:4Fe-4S dicluster domain-containing protein [Alphaproteobacteria bacterium]